MCEDFGQKALDALMTEYLKVVAQRDRALAELWEIRKVHQGLIRKAQDKAEGDK